MEVNFFKRDLIVHHKLIMINKIYLDLFIHLLWEPGPISEKFTGTEIISSKIYWYTKKQYCMVHIVG